MAAPVWISVKVHPNAKKEVLVSLGANRYEAWVRAKPMEGRANDALINLLARSLQLPQGAFHLIKGAMTRHKVFRVIQ
jgi:uncharacterized protein (TIGR00251 family)